MKERIGWMEKAFTTRRVPDRERLLGYEAVVCEGSRTNRVQMSGTAYTPPSPPRNDHLNGCCDGIARKLCLMANVVLDGTESTNRE